MATNLDYTQYTELVVGRSHPTLTDTDNRALREILSRSGFGPDTLFDGFPIGNSAVNAGSSDFAQATADARVNAAIARAVTAGKPYCFVPRVAWDGLVLLPYTASLVTFNTAVRMLREGGNPDVYDVRAYGAAGDAATNDSPAIQAALNAVPVVGSNPTGALGTAVHGIVWFPPGTYELSATLLVNPNTLIRGSGAPTTLIEPQITTIDIFTIAGPGGVWQPANIEVSDLRLDFHNLVSAKSAINIANATHIHVRRVEFARAGSGNGVILNGNADEITIDNCSFLTVGNPVLSNATTNNNNRVTNCTFIAGGTGGSAITLAGNNTTWLISGNNFEGSSIGTVAIYLNGANTVLLENNFFENWVTANVVANSGVGYGLVFINNNFHALSSAGACLLLNSAGPNDRITLRNNTYSILGNGGTTLVGALLGATTNVRSEDNVSTGSGTNITQIAGTNYAGNVFTGQTSRGVGTPTEAVLVSGVNALTADYFLPVALTAARIVGAPLNPTLGQTITFVMVQGGAGGFAITWNAIFKGFGGWSNAGNAVNTRASASCQYDGTNWNLTSMTAWAL